MNEAPTAPTLVEATPATAQAEAKPVAPETATQTPAPAATSDDAKAAVPALTPEQDAAQKQLDANLAVQRVIQAKENQCAAEVQAVADKYGCELIVGHSVKVRFKNQP